MRPQWWTFASCKEQSASPASSVDPRVATPDCADVGGNRREEPSPSMRPKWWPLGGRKTPQSVAASGESPASSASASADAGAEESSNVTANGVNVDGNSQEEPSESASNSEAIEMLLSLLKTYIGKRSAGDILSIVSDPTVPFRLLPIHQRRYEMQLEAFDETHLDYSVGGSVGSSHSASADCSRGDTSGLSKEDVAAEGFLPYVALASVFARAAYGTLMRRGSGDRIHKFLKGAAVSACREPEAEEHITAFVELAGAQRGDVLMSSWNEQTFQPAFVVFWVHSLRWLVVAIRGSSEWKSILTDVAADECEVAGGLAHSGIARSAQWVLQQIRPTVVPLLQDIPEYRMVCIGHSLGGDVAALLAVLIRECSPGPSSPAAVSVDASPQSDSGSDGPRSEHTQVQYPVAMRNCVAYAFGASPIMSPELAARCAPYVMSVARDVDYITRVSVFGMDRLVLELTENSAAHLTKQWLMTQLGRSSGTPKPRDRAFGSTAPVPNVVVPPGRLLHIHKCGAGRQVGPVRLFWPLPSFYHELLVSTHMFPDHLPIRYVEDLLEVLRKAAPEQADQLYLKNRAKESDAQETVRKGIEAILHGCSR